MTPTETELSKAIVQYLEATGAVVIRANAGWAKRGGRFIRLAPEGTPDILAFLPCGVGAGFEVKAPNRRDEKNGGASDKQIERIGEIRRTGNIAGVVYSILDVQKLIDDYERKRG